MAETILEVRDLHVRFDTLEGTTHAVRGVSFKLKRGQTLALVGESGSGKSVTSYAILRLIQPPGRIAGGQMLFAARGQPPVDIAALKDKSDRLFRVRGGQIGMIFQEPMTALSPVHTVGNQLCEAVTLHRGLKGKAARELAADMLVKVGITEPKRRLDQYPFELSGGMRQRVVIAMALVCNPEVLIADEPTTALDVTVQAQILRLIESLRDELNTSVIFITHDLGVVAQIADHVVVMNQGQIVEAADVHQLFERPFHPYTKRLLAAVPRFDADDSFTRRLQDSNCDEIPDRFSLTPPGNDYRTSMPSKMLDLAGGRSVRVWPAGTGVPA